MKQLLILLTAVALISCKGDKKEESLYPNGAASDEGTAPKLTQQQQLGQEIFDGKGNCYTCHKPMEKAIGPAIREIGKIYKEKKGDMVTFLKGNGEPIVDPAQFPVMKTNFYITKTFTDEELKALEAYIYSVE